MKYIYIKWGIGSILILLIVINILRNKLIFRQDERGLWDGFKVEKMEIEGVEYHLIIAENPSQSSKGLMYIHKPFDYDGMIFKFKEASKQTFWNKNTYEDLKLYWILNGEVVGKSDLPSIKKSGEIVAVGSPGPADTVVEIIK